MIIKDTNSNKLNEIMPENNINNKTSLPNALNDSVIHKPEGIKKITSKKLNISSESEEITYEPVQNNKTIKRGTNEQIIVQDELIIIKNH